MPLALILPRGDQWYLLRKPLIRRDKGDTLSLLVQFLLKLRVPCAPPPASLLISTIIFELAATGPTLPFLHLFLVPPKSPPFPPWRLQLFSGFLRFCVCVFSSHSFWTSNSLDVPAGVTQEEGHTGFIIHLLSAVRALIFLARRIQPFLPSSTVKSNFVY